VQHDMHPACAVVPPPRQPLLRGLL